MSELVGRNLGNYRLTEQIGSGGMGTVYRAHDPGANREVAVKVLPPQLTMDPTFLARFHNEGVALAKLEHPHIVPLYAVGDEGGIPYLVMRYLPGGSLQERARAGQITYDFLVKMIHQVCDALEFAHRNNVIHRDIKPGNILLDADGNAYLADFGIAKMLANSAYLSSTGGFVGTPAYMSPEQWRGETLDGRTDIYSLGCVVYQVVTGGVPYQAESTAAFMTKHLTAPIPSAREQNRDVPEELDSLLFRAMAKDREERPLSALKFAHEMANAIEQTGPQTLPLWRTPPMPRPQPKPQPQPQAAAAPLPPTAGMPYQSPVRVAPISPATYPPEKARGPSVGMILLGAGGTVIGVAVAAVCLIAVLWMLGVIPGIPGISPATQEPTQAVTSTPQDQLPTEEATQPPQTEIATELPTEVVTEPPPVTAAPARFGFSLDNPVTSNNQWAPISGAFGGAEMVLVPAGCFMMGSNDGDPDERPVSQQCFSQPFWIDRTEVTYGAFGYYNVIPGCPADGDSYPRICVSWEDARSYCLGRGGRLPSEAEWEYAARGPDDLVYPWGNAFVDSYVINKANGGGHAWTVTGRPGGASWVGALDLSGNVWEWVNSLYMPYPFDPNDGRENTYGGGERVARGGSFDGGSTRASYRYGFPSAQYYAIGFRCVRDWSPSDTP